MSAVAVAAGCDVHRWGRSPITRGMTALLLSAVVTTGLYIVGHGAVRLAGEGLAWRVPAPALAFLANYLWLASISFGFIGTLRYSVYKEVAACPACSAAGAPPFYSDPTTAFHRYITMVIVSTVSAFGAVLVGFLPH